MESLFQPQPWLTNSGYWLVLVTPFTIQIFIRRHAPVQDEHLAVLWNAILTLKLLGTAAVSFSALGSLAIQHHAPWTKLVILTPDTWIPLSVFQMVVFGYSGMFCIFSSVVVFWDIFSASKVKVDPYQPDQETSLPLKNTGLLQRKRGTVVDQIRTAIQEIKAKEEKKLVTRQTIDILVLWILSWLHVGLQALGTSMFICELVFTAFLAWQQCESPFLLLHLSMTSALVLRTDTPEWIHVITLGIGLAFGIAQLYKEVLHTTIDAGAWGDLDAYLGMFTGGNSTSFGNLYQYTGFTDYETDQFAFRSVTLHYIHYILVMTGSAVFMAQLGIVMIKKCRRKCIYF